MKRYEVICDVLTRKIVYVSATSYEDAESIVIDGEYFSDGVVKVDIFSTMEVEDERISNEH